MARKGSVRKGKVFNCFEVIMTKKEIIKGNKALAEFMRYTWKTDKRYVQDI